MWSCQEVRAQDNSVVMGPCGELPKARYASNVHVYGRETRPAGVNLCGSPWFGCPESQVDGFMRYAEVITTSPVPSHPSTMRGG